MDDRHHGVVMAEEERSSQNPQQAARFPPAKIWSCKREEFEIFAVVPEL
jgi:hypothetical protein